MSSPSPAPVRDSSAPSIESRIRKHRYGSENELQYYETFLPDAVGEDSPSQNAKQDEDKVWIVYVTRFKAQTNGNITIS